MTSLAVPDSPCATQQASKGRSCTRVSRADRPLMQRFELRNYGMPIARRIRVVVRTVTVSSPFPGADRVKGFV